MLFLDLNKMSKLTELTMSSFLIVVSNISNNADPQFILMLLLIITEFCVTNSTFLIVKSETER